MPRALWLALVSPLFACLPDNPVVEGGETSAETGDEDVRVEDGPLGCPAGESCTIVALSQTLDDRVDLFTARGAGPTYRGALDLDLVPNQNGDISGELLDEPYGLAWDGAGLNVLIGHYPLREVGSLLRFPAAGLASYDAGELIPRSEWFASDQVIGELGVELRGLEVEEPLSMLHHPSGARLISVFANDLMVPEDQWTNASELLVVDEAGERTSVAAGCAGAWSIVSLDEDGDAVAVACDGDETLVIFDAEALASGGVPSLRCTGAVPFAGKRVRYLAPDGLGGALLVEHPQIVSTTEIARLWWFDGDCQLREISELDGALSWATRELVRIPAADPRWLLARTDGDARGVVILAGEVADGSVAVCGRLDGLDEAGAWVSAASGDSLRPHALALTRDGLGLAVSTGPTDYDDAGPGYGSLWWTGLDYGDDPCAAAAVDPVELGAAAPAVDPGVPQTWRRAPDVLTLIEVDE